MISTVIFLIFVFALFGFLILNSKEARKGAKKKNFIQLMAIIVCFGIFVISVNFLSEFIVSSISRKSKEVEKIVLAQYGYKIKDLELITNESEIGKYIAGESAYKGYGKFTYRITTKQGLKKKLIVEIQTDGELLVIASINWEDY